MDSSAEYFPHLSIHSLAYIIIILNAHIDINNKAKEKEQIFLLFVK